jgi:hypothetical protein
MRETEFSVRLKLEKEVNLYNISDFCSVIPLLDRGIYGFHE